MQETELTNDYYIRRKAVDFGIPLLTNIQLANRLAESILRARRSEKKSYPIISGFGIGRMNFPPRFRYSLCCSIISSAKFQARRSR